MTEPLLNHRYQIVKTLGYGGFGETFLAEDTHLPSRRLCVIKRLKPITVDPFIQQLVEDRFAKEASVLEKLGSEHPQIPSLYAYFQEQDQYFLVQEWIEGDTLTKALQKEGSMTETVVKSLLISILDTLIYIHSQKIVHRDIKPDNIIIRERDQKPVLIDFGAVKESMGTIINSQGGFGSSIVIGTPGFMPSEQAAGRPVFSSDLYALGLVAIYLLTSTTPHQLSSDPASGEIIWHHLIPTLSPSLTSIIDKAIMSHPRDRFSTAQEMKKALESSAIITPLIIPENVTLPPPEISTAKTSVIIAPTVSQEDHSEKIDQPVTKKQSIIAIIIAIIGLLVGGILAIPSEINPLNFWLNSPFDGTIKAPDKALESYFKYLNQKQYLKAWNLLSQSYQENLTLHPQGFDSYTQFWTTVNQVSLSNTEIIKHTDYQSVVKTTWTLELKNGKIESITLEFEMIWDDSKNKWLINKVSIPKSSS